MIWIIIGIVIYLLSAYGVWRYFHLAHSKGGIWSVINATMGDIFWVLLPIGNTIAVIVLWSDRNPIEGHESIITNKFFKIK